MNRNLFGDKITVNNKPRQGILFRNVIKSISYDQEEIIQNILDLHCKTDIELDPTYSIGNFYKGKIKPPKYKFDIKPQADGVQMASSDELPLLDESINTMMYDPPFLSSGYSDDWTDKMADRFGNTQNMGRLFRMYYLSMVEFHRILKKNGILIFKCQDCVDGRYNWMTHCEVLNMAVEIGFYPRDLFILLSRSRIISGQNQVHARKFHCYFWVFEKKQSYIKYGTGANYDYNEQPGKRIKRKKRN